LGSLAGRAAVLALAATVASPLVLAAQSYAAAIAGDTLRGRYASAGKAEIDGHAAFGAVIEGYLSPRGLPPIAGAMHHTDTGQVFSSYDGPNASTLPVVGTNRD
jgi:hypothetical protein